MGFWCAIDKAKFLHYSVVEFVVVQLTDSMNTIYILCSVNTKITVAENVIRRHSCDEMTYADVRL